VVVAGPAHGTLTLAANGGFTYTPAANYNGPDSFTYRANDGTADSNVATVSIAVAPVDDAPVAVNDSYSVNEDTTLSVPSMGVLTNDTDPDSPTLSAFAVTGPAHGTLQTFNADGSFTYVPNPNFHGTDSFTYVANDDTSDSNTATVTITIPSRPSATCRSRSTVQRRPRKTRRSTAR
jgi:VCBS repeat-containing protein